MRKKLLSLLLCVLCGTVIAFGQTKVTGTIINAGDKQPIGFATIAVKDANVVATSSDDGTYSITLPAGSTTLIFSFFGMKTQEIAVNGRDVVNVALESEDFMLEETVVIGYGTMKKRDVAGSISNIKSDEISKAAVENFQKALQGKAAGVQITAASGTPGGAMDVVIRGRRGLGGSSSSPIYIIDGVQVTTGDQGGGILNSTDALAGLNPDDIESIDILKDGASASIYGAQAANGVILITTKKGREGKTSISFKSSWGWQTVANTIPTLNGPQYAEQTLTAYKNLYGANHTSYLSKLEEFRNRGWGTDGYSNAPTYDWFNAVFGVGFTQEYQLNLTGGNEKTTFFISAGYTDDKGTMKNTWFKRASARLNLGHQLTSWLKFSTNNSFSNVNQQQASTTGSANPARVAFLVLPTEPIYDDNGDYIANLSNDSYYMFNIVQQLDYNKYYGTTNKWISGNDFEITFMDGLTFKSSYGIDYMEISEELFLDPRTRAGAQYAGYVQNTNTRVTKLQTDQVLSYQKEFKAIHRINAMVGFSLNEFTRRISSAAGIGVADPGLQALGSTATPYELEGYSTGYRTVGTFARLNYVLMDKYILTGTIRYDGSSVFGKDVKFGTFPSISAAWRISDESFMDAFKFISDMKLKASYGVTGNSDIGDYAWRNLLSGSGEYDGIAALYPSAIGNDELTWEESQSVNTGLSVSMLRNRIMLDVDYYITNTKNLLYYRPIPSTTMYEYMWANVGGVRNSGWEFLVTSVNIHTSKFKWDTNFNFAFNKNEVTSLIDDQEVVGSYKVGESVSSEQAYRWAGVNPSDGRPMYYDKDNYITYNPRPDDRVWTEGTDPTFFGGLTNTFSYAGLELSFTFQFQSGARAYWSDKSVLVDFATDANSLLDVYNNQWRYPGDRTWVPQIRYNNLYAASARPATSPDDYSTLMFEKTDFIKLKTVSLNYTLPQKWVSKLKLSSVQVYAQAYNLWTATPYPGYDPEFTGSDRGTYPQSRTYNIGLKIDF